MLPGKEPIQTREGDTEQDVLREIRERAANGIEAWQHNWDAALEDVEFLAGAQWPEAIRKEREDEGRPCLTLNKLPQYVDQVSGDQRQNRPAISIHPVEADAASEDNKIPNVAGNEDYSLAQVYEALIRNIEYISNAEAHYDTAFQHAAEGGFGWLRLITKYSSDDAFEQDLCIKSIANRFAVIMDPEATEPDCSDAGWCFIGENMKRSEFTKRYPDASLGDLTDAERTGYTWWVTQDMVRVAEYFYREPATRELLLLSDGRTVWHDEVEDVLDELAEMGDVVIRRRKVKTYKVKWMKVTAYSVLEGPIDWPGRTIPVVPVFGKSITLGDKTYYRGLIRFAKDAQRMHNFWMTAATERVALAPKAPWTGPAEAFEGYEHIWQNANRQNYSFLPYNPTANGDRPSRAQPADMPAAEINLALAMTDEMKATVGMYDASIGNEGAERSGRAILARQRQGDRGTFAYIDNLARAIRRMGQLCIEVIPRIYDSERVLRLRFEDGEGDWVRINQTVRDEQTGKDILVHDIAAGKFDVTVKAGPSYQTQRMEAAESLMQFVQAVPASGAVVLDLIAKNMDWPGSQEIATRLKKTLPAGILSKDEMEKEGIEPPQPTPEQQATMAKAKADTAQAEADMEGANADKVKAQADVEKARADTAKAQADMAEAQRQLAEIEQAAAIAGPGTMEETVRNLVAEALAELMEQGQQVPGMPSATPAPQEA